MNVTHYYEDPLKYAAIHFLKYTSYSRPGDTFLSNFTHSSTSLTWVKQALKKNVKMVF